MVTTRSESERTLRMVESLLETFAPALEAIEAYDPEANDVDMYEVHKSIDAAVARLYRRQSGLTRHLNRLNEADEQDRLCRLAMAL